LGEDGSAIGPVRLISPPDGARGQPGWPLSDRASDEKWTPSFCTGQAGFTWGFHVAGPGRVCRLSRRRIFTRNGSSRASSWAAPDESVPSRSLPIVHAARHPIAGTNVVPAEPAPRRSTAKARSRRSSADPGAAFLPGRGEAPRLARRRPRRTDPPATRRWAGFRAETVLERGTKRAEVIQPVRQRNQPRSLA